MMQTEKIVKTRDVDSLEMPVFGGLRIKGFHEIDTYEAHGGYQTWKDIIQNRIPPEHVTDLVKKSGLRGRGGAGFATGLKWSFIKRDHEGAVYLLCNADESEPGTFKDREILVHAPHLLLEGMLLAAYAIGAHRSYIYIRGEFEKAWRRVQQAIDDAYSRGYLGHNIMGSLFDNQIHIHRGGGAYVCGEETGLIESIEGRRGTPRHKPPYPAAKGLDGQPTVVNNVETLAAVPAIVKNGPIWYRQWGTFRSPGTKLFSVSGHAANPGVYELPLGYPARKFYEDVIGGCKGGKKLKAVFVGGTSVPVMPASAFLDSQLDYESISEHGGALGSGAVILMDEDTDMVKVCHSLTRFYSHESCGHCTPCRVGTACAHDMMVQLLAHKGKTRDLETLERLMDVMPITAHCGLGQTAPLPISSTMKFFRGEFEDYVNGHQN